MARILKRPMFRRGGMPSNQGVTSVRPQYMGGGMGGIMSGIVPRPDAGLTPRVGLQDGTTFTRGGGVMQGSPYSTRAIPFRPPATVAQVPAVIPQGPPLPKGVPAEKIDMLRKLGRLTTKAGRAVKSTLASGLPYLYAAGSVSGPAIIAGMNKPKTYEELDFIKKYDEGSMGSIIDETSSAEDIEAFDKERVRLSDTKKFTPIEKTSDIFSSQEEIDKKIQDSKKEDDNNLLDTNGGEKNIKDEESALMKAYKEYAPIFEKELGVSPEDTKKQLYLQLAKFGAGVAAQPGGDLVGAIGKAAMPAIEGAGETVKEQSSAKRQAKLLALQTAISEGKPGPIGQGVKDIAKIYKVSESEAAKIYEKWNARTAAGQADRTKRLTEFAEKRLSVNPEGFSMSIEKLLKDPELKDLVGEFNKKLPIDKSGAPDPDEMVDKEYYVGENGNLYRVDKSVEPPLLLEPGDKGFKDSKKKSSTNKK